MNAFAAAVAGSLVYLSQAPANVCRAVPVPGGTADGSTAVILTADFTIEAIDAHTGHTRWRTKSEASPIALIPDGVVAADWSAARPSVMRVLILDPATGHVRAASSEIELPASVARARMSDGNVQLSAHAATGQRMLVDWTASASRTSGANPGDIDREREAGSVEIDATSGRVISARDVPAPDDWIRATSSPMPYWRNGRARSSGWKIGESRFALEMSTDREGVAISLQRDTAPAVRLLTAAAPTAWLSPDGSTLFIRPGQGKSVPVTIVDVATAARLATIPYEPSATDFALSCGRVFYTSEGTPTARQKATRTLKVVDLEGRPLWSRVVPAPLANESSWR